MSPNSDNQESQSAAEKLAALQEIVNTDLGEPAPLAGYSRPLADDDRAQLEAELADVEQAQAAAAARLYTLYAD